MMPRLHELIRIILGKLVDGATIPIRALITSQSPLHWLFGIETIICLRWINM